MRIKQIFISIAIALISSTLAHAQTTKDRIKSRCKQQKISLDVLLKVNYSR